MTMKNLRQPGEIVREECVVPPGLTVTDGARALGVSRQALNNLVNERSGISAEMATRLEKAFGTSADLWVRLQTAYDLAQARLREKEMKVQRYKLPGAAPV